MQSFHTAWVLNCCPRPAPYHVKQEALANIGFIGVVPADKESRTLDWIWQLSMQDKGTWTQLIKFLNLWCRGGAKDQKKGVAKAKLKQRERKQRQDGGQWIMVSSKQDW